ncbi:MAG: 7-carboxy-7-deazaguanine synthase QueE [Planctomycetaceae bacterium]
MRISEIYPSIQGEGKFAGTPSVFIRTTGCNLRCWFCDTPFTSWEPEGEELSIAQILDATRVHEARHVVITGGEPMLHGGLVELTQELHAAGRFITIETAGTLELPVTADLMSISPKLGNSTPTPERSQEWSIRHAQVRHQPDVIRRLADKYQCQFKFVIDKLSDVAEVRDYLLEFPEIDIQTVWLMPQGVTPEELAAKADWLQQAATAAGFHFTSRWHIETYGNARRR